MAGLSEIEGMKPMKLHIILYHTQIMETLRMLELYIMGSNFNGWLKAYSLLTLHLVVVYVHTPAV